MEILVTAVINPNSPSDIVIVPRGADDPAGSIAVRRGVAVARVNRPPLTAWLRDTLNHLLAGTLPDQPRPTGRLIERGAFVHDGTQVWVGDWYGRGNRIMVARCPDVEAASQLTERLQALLD